MSSDSITRGLVTGVSAPKFSGQRAKFSVVGARKKYFLMNFRFRKVFAPLSAVREKSTGRVSSPTLAMVCTPMKMFLFSKNRPRSLVLLPPLVARTKLPQKKLFPLLYNFVLSSSTTASPSIFDTSIPTCVLCPLVNTRGDP